jgi:hypothetical protein
MINQWPPAGPRTLVREGIQNLKAVREAVGPDFRMGIDLHGKAFKPLSIFMRTNTQQTRKRSSKRKCGLNILGGEFTKR